MTEFAKKIVLDRSSSPTDLRTTEWKNIHGGRTRLRFEHTPNGVLWAYADGSFELINHYLSPLEYRFYLTYFDQIDIPILPVPQFWFVEPEWEYLHDVDFLAHSVVGSPEAYEWEPCDEVVPDFLYAPATALKQRNDVEPGVWSFSADYRESLADRELIENGSLEVDMFELLPVPSEANSFPDIIAYKVRYRDELLRLRASMQSLYQQTLADPDLPRSVATISYEINRAVEDMRKSMKGAGIGSLQLSLKAELDLRAITTSAAAFGFLTAHGVPPIISVPLAGTSALLSLKPKKADKEVLISNCPVDFSYAVGFNRYLNR